MKKLAELAMTTSAGILSEALKERKNGRDIGLDCLRACAILLVLYQHIASNFEYLGLPVDFLGVNVGQAGVGLFCGLSGYLVLRGDKSPSIWVSRRFWKVFPAYWTVLLLSLIGNSVFGYKNVSLGSIIYQFLGMSYFVPAESRLNVATWFITLILVCYFVAFCMLICSNDIHRLILLVALIFATVVMLNFRIHVGFVRQVLAFECGLFLMLSKRVRLAKSSTIVVGVLVVLLGLGLDAKYALVSTVALMVTGIIRFDSEFVLVRWLSRYSYEIFLTHGLFVVFFAKFCSFAPWLAICMAMLLTGILSVVLNRATERLMFRLL